MALGLARIFGVVLPMNFNSPLKATSIVEFWGRWHITLTRFLTAYVYTPIVLSLTRRRMARGKPVLRGTQHRGVGHPCADRRADAGDDGGLGLLARCRRSSSSSGGFCHGVMLTINQAWRICARASGAIRRATT